MNFLDKSIAWVSPGTGLRRARARVALNALERLAYEGSKTGRRTDGWSTAGSSANAEIGSSLTKLRDRSRSLFRDSPVKKALRVLVSNIVGTGIIPQPRTGDKTLDKKVTEFFNRWAEECDADDQLDLYGLQALIVRTIIESGECLVRFRNRRPQDGMETIPLQLQVLEPDHLDLSKSQATATGHILQGVEFDKLGTRIAYWLFSNHPGEALPSLRSGKFGSFMSHRVPASEILHIYVKERPGQIRGVPWLAPVLLKIRDLEDYDDAELVRKKIEACLAAFITQAEGESGPPLGVVTSASGEPVVEQFEPGMIARLKPGEEVTLNTPTGVGGYDAYLKSQQRLIAAGIGVTYQQLAGDLSDANFSNYKAGHIDFKGMVREFQYLTLMPMCLTPIWRRFIEHSVMAGEMGEPNYKVRWMPPAFGTVDEAKEAKGVQLKIRSGTATLGQAIAEQGYDLDEQLEEIAETFKKLDALGIVLDSDPRKGKGTTNAQAEGANDEEERKEDAA